MTNRRPLGASDATLVNGPESGHVVDAVGALLDGRTWEAREALRTGAESSSWAAVLHRLDVAGRALVSDAAADEGADEVVAALAATEGTTPADRDLLVRWRDGDGIAASIDLLNDEVELTDDHDRAWHALGLLAWLVDRAGFPAEVVV